MEQFSSGDIWFAFLLTLLAGISTGIGAVIAFMFKTRSTIPLSIGLGFSAGVMIYISFEEILDKSREAFSSFYGGPAGEFLALFAFVAGIGLTALIDRFIPEDVNPHELKSPGEVKELRADSDSSPVRFDLHRTGLFTAIAIAIHNFPEGFATFIAALSDPTLGIAIAVAVAIHNIPEGIAVSLPIYHATGNRKRAFWYSFSSGLVEPLGAIVGFLLLAPFLNEAVMGIIFGMVAGIMIYISFDELLPAARVYGNAHSTLLGIVSGIIVMAVSLILFDLL